MKLYRIETKDKKSIKQVETWTHPDGRIFYVDQLWRWGHVVIEVEDDQEFDVEYNSVNEFGFEVDDYAIQDQEMDDGISLDFNTDGDQSLLAEVDEMWDTDGFAAFEEAGWSFEECETTMYGPLLITEIKS